MAKHKKKHSKKSKKKHHRQRSSSENDSDGSSSGWEEITKTSSKRAKRRRKQSSSEESDSSDEEVQAGRGNEDTCGPSKPTKANPVPEREDWLGDSDIFASMSKDYRTEKMERHLERKQMERRVNLDKPGQHERELNPYWKDGGAGVPENQPNPSNQSGAGPSGGRSLPAAESGQGQLQWLQRALRRLKEEAQEKSLPLEEVAKERWGSLPKLEDLIRDAEIKAGVGRRDRHSDRHESDRRLKDRNDWRRRREDDESHRPRMRRPNSDDDDEHESRKATKRGFARPRDYSGDEDDRRVSSDRNNRTGDSRSGGYRREYRREGERRSWRKDEPQRSSSRERRTRVEYDDKKTMEEDREQKSNRDRQEIGDNDTSRTESRPSQEQTAASSQETSRSENQRAEQVKVLSDTELNKLAAKLLKAEMMGNTEQAEKLRGKIEAARKLREANPDAGKGGTQKEQFEVIVLTKTDSRGVSRPVQPLHEEGPSNSKRKQKIKPDSHSGGERMRYFADDDRQSLNEMFEREKLSTAADDVAMFAKMAAKMKVKPGDDDYTVDDAFVERAARHDDSKGQKERNANKAIQEHHAMKKTLDSCFYCLESPACLKHLIVSVGSHVALSLPAYQSLTEGHCILTPTQHISALTLADEDVWHEVTRFRAALTAMFAADDQDCVFFETAMGLSSSRKPHTVLHCVPVPREVGELLPMYFKKAILESETEWAQNKKLVDLSVKKGLRYSIPKGLPYFAVDFGTDHGFAHVIEDENEFPKHFGLEIVGGLLDCEPRLWLKKRHENFQEQSRKAIKFSKMWSPHEFNEKLV